MSRRVGSVFLMLFQKLFYLHMIIIAILVIFLTVRGVLSDNRKHHFQPKTWYLLVLPSTACAGILGSLWESFTTFSPSKAFRAAFWLGPLLTCAVGIMLVCIETPVTLAAALVFITCSILLSLYACWAGPRFEHSCNVLSVSTAHCPPKVRIMVFLTMVFGTLYLCFLMSGIGGAMATRTKFDILFIFLILVSLIWTMHVIKNVMQVTVSHVKYMRFTSSMDVDYNEALQKVQYSMGSISIGSILVPVFTVVRGTARVMRLLSEDVDEFMLSCADCCSGVASRVMAYANRWGFVYVGTRDYGIVDASLVTWEMFRQARMEKLINSDLTSSFCFLCGMAAGSTCALGGGISAIFIHKNYAAEVAIYAFLTGYLMTRAAMAWIQACVTAYYVAYAERPQNADSDATITNYIWHLQRSRV